MSLVTQLQKLTAFGRGLCTRLYDTKIWQDRTDILYFNDPRYSKLNRLLIYKYPDVVPDKASMELYQRDAAHIVNEMLTWIYVLVDVANYIKTTLGVLADVAEKTNPLKFSLCPYLFEQFNDLYVLYIQILLLLPPIDHKKLLTVFGLCHKIARNSKLDDNHKLVVDFLGVYSHHDPKNMWRKIREEFKPFSKYIVTGLVEFLNSFPKVRNPTLLRKDGMFSIIHPATLENFASHPLYSEIRLNSKIYTWLVYGMLSAHEALNDSFSEIIRVILKEGPFAPVYRDHSCYISKDTIAITKSWKIKDSRPIKEAKESGLVSSGLMHKEMRIYLRHELGTLLSLLNDTPALLGPKMEMILSALSLCKHEVLWFFRHFKEPVKSRVYAKGAQNYDDPRITSLIYDLFQFYELICDHADLIKEYYVEYLLKEDLPYLKEVRDIVKTTMNQDGGDIIEELIQMITNLDTSPTCDFEVIRQHWYQAQLKFAWKQTSVLVSKIQDIIPKINQILFRTRIVDSLPVLLSECISLRELWYFKDKLNEIFTAAIADGPDQPTHCAAYLSLLGQFPENATAYYLVEQEMIGKEVVQIAENFLVKLIERIRELLNSISTHFIQYNNQIVPQNAIFALAAKHEEFLPLAVKREAPREPAFESDFRLRQTLRPLQLYQKNLAQLCLSLSQYHTYVIYDRAFTPVEYLAEALQLWLKKFCHKILYGPTGKDREGFFQPPAQFIRQIHTFISVLKDIEHHVGIDMGSLVSSVMLSEIYSQDLGPSDRGYEWIKKETNPKSEDSPEVRDKLKKEDESAEPKTMLDVIVQWYSTFVTSKLSKGAKCEEAYSAVRNGFVSKRGPLGGKPEAYCDLVELMKLCELIGPHGVKAIDREIIKWLIPKMREIETILKNNQADCERIREIYMDETSCPSLLKSFKARFADIDRFIDRSIAIGNVLHFRRLLHSALENVTEQKIPFLYNSVHTAFDQYPRNVWMEASLMPIDALAMDLGIDVGIADHELRNALLPFVQRDKEVWLSLPVLYAVSFMVSTHWRDTTHNFMIGAHENNIHVLAETIPWLVVLFSSLVSSTHALADITEVLRTYMSMSAVFLLRMAKRRYEKQRDKDVKDLASVIVFLDMFIKACPMVSRSALEEILPYSLVRSMWREVYSTEVKA